MNVLYFSSVQRERRRSYRYAHTRYTGSELGLVLFSETLLQYILVLPCSEICVELSHAFRKLHQIVHDLLVEGDGDQIAVFVI